MPDERRLNCAIHTDMLREVRDDVRGIVGTVGLIREDVAVLKAGHGQNTSRLDKLAERVGGLETWKARAIGGAIVAALLGGGGVMAWAKVLVP